jgi:hypothetical protein
MNRLTFVPDRAPEPQKIMGTINCIHVKEPWPSEYQKLLPNENLQVLGRIFVVVNQAQFLRHDSSLPLLL